MRRHNLSPKDYQTGFQIAQQEFEFFVQLNNRLKAIRAIQQLKRGQLFLEAIDTEEQAEADWSLRGATRKSA